MRIRGNIIWRERPIIFSPQRIIVKLGGFEVVCGRVMPGVRRLNCSKGVKKVMFRRHIPAYVLSLLLTTTASPWLGGQSLAPDLAKVSESVEGYFSQKRPGWKHETVPPATPPGSQPSPDVVIHFWSSEKCLMAEVIIDGVRSGEQPVPCRVKLAIDRSPSASAARERLGNFVLNEQSASPIPIGDKGYIWRGSEVVFIKGKFTFWLGGSLELRVGGFTNSREFIEKLAREIAKATPAA